MLLWGFAFLVAAGPAFGVQPRAAQTFTSAFARADHRVDPAARPREPGTIEIHTRARMLYFILPDGRALRYPVAVGRLGRQWYGATRIVSKRLSPAWTP